MKRKKTSAKSNGFTLVEVLIALVIASLMIPATLAVFSTATGAVARAGVRCETRLAVSSALQNAASQYRCGEIGDAPRIFPGTHPVVVRLNGNTAVATIHNPDGSSETTTSALLSAEKE